MILLKYILATHFSVGTYVLCLWNRGYKSKKNTWINKKTSNTRKQPNEYSNRIYNTRDKF